MPDDRTSGAPIPYATWLATVHEILGDAQLRGLARHAETLRQAPDLASLPAAPR